MPGSEANRGLTGPASDEFILELTGEKHLLDTRSS
jgi:hypothetical protein